MTHNPRFSILQGRAVKDLRVSDPQFRTLAALGTYTDEEGWCWPSLTTLGTDLGKSKQAVGRDIVTLKRLGYVEVHPRFDDKGGRRSNRYRLVFDLPRQPVVDAPSTSEVYTPSTSEVDVKDTKERPKDLLDAVIHYHLSPKAIRDAMAEHFKLTPNWEGNKFNRQWMEWAMENNVSPEQIKMAANKWRDDKQFNWQHPTLKAIQENWLRLMDSPKSNFESEYL